MIQEELYLQHQKRLRKKSYHIYEFRFQFYAKKRSADKLEPKLL